MDLRPSSTDASPGGHGGAADLQWLEIAASASPAHPTAIADIFARRLDGITISGVFSQAEVEGAVAVLAQHRDERTEAMFGSMLGMPLAELPNVSDDVEDRTVYLDGTARCRRIYHSAFGIDPHDRLADVIAPMAGGLRVEPPSEKGRDYNPGNVRWFEAGSRGLPAHAGNEFQLQRDGTTSHLRATTSIRDHLSYFVVLQAPEQGGALSVYDRLYDSFTPEQAQWREAGRDDADFDGIPARKIAPGPGTMVIFGGGWRWHRVDPIAGTQARITYGGFAGPSTDGRSLHFWF
jgi:hypothetical protein